MNTRGFFISGTGTDVGKTFACGFLLAILRELQFNTLYYKPIQCGPASWGSKEFVGGDSQLIRELFLHPNTECTWFLRNPSSPHLAFAFENKTFNIQPIQEKLISSRKDFEFVVMEGAGGIRVPITDKLEMTDLAKLSSFPVLVVAQPGLGTINHTLLTLEHLSNRRLPIAGFLFSTPTKDSEALAADNAHMIQSRTGIPFLGTVPHWSGSWPAESLRNHPLRDYLLRQRR